MSDAAAAAPTAKTWPAMSIAQAHAMLTAPGMPFDFEGAGRVVDGRE